MQIFPTNSKSIIDPLSLFTCIKLTKDFLASESNSERCEMSIDPFFFNFTYAISILNSWWRWSNVCSTAWCSVRALIMRSTFKVFTASVRAQLSASVPPEQKIISWELTLRFFAFFSLLRKKNPIFVLNKKNPWKSS